MENEAQNIIDRLVDTRVKHIILDLRSCERPFPLLANRNLEDFVSSYVAGFTLVQSVNLMGMILTASETEPAFFDNDGYDSQTLKKSIIKNVANYMGVLVAKKLLQDVDFNQMFQDEYARLFHVVNLNTFADALVDIRETHPQFFQQANRAVYTGMVDDSHINEVRSGRLSHSVILLAYKLLDAGVKPERLGVKDIYHISYMRNSLSVNSDNVNGLGWADVRLNAEMLLSNGPKP